MSSPWPFVAWGIDVIGPIEPAASNRHRFILVAINYFTKWVEAASYKSVTKKVVADFVRNNLILYGTEAVIPTEVEIPSLRIIQEAELGDVDWIRKRIDQLTLIDEKIMVVVCHGQLYRQRMIRAFHKRVRTRIFEVGQLVLKRIFPHQDDYKGKFAPNWQGPYMVRKVLSGGALVLSEMDGTEWPKPINSDAVKRYYV
ncbi:uncharacterized protein LOC125839036 [Solanum verrucosum]|uniref:uncharacterized protein LOC125839036 n=1 Tax=Solanum verrucosum TaxID=315347 RepID=UPI0020D06A44|nr:uncharacterized protein LOC125839036 [Solanum verrucosum]